MVALGKRWTLLHLLDPSMFLNGYAALRLSDIRRIERRGGKESFPIRALRHFGESPCSPEGVDLDSTQVLLTSAALHYPLVTVHLEERDPTVCYIGRPVRVSSRTLHLREIAPNATGDESPTSWRLAEITRVEFGGRYEHALHLVGGD